VNRGGDVEPTVVQDLTGISDDYEAENEPTGPPGAPSK